MESMRKKPVGSALLIGSLVLIGLQSGCAVPSLIGYKGRLHIHVDKEQPHQTGGQVDDRFVVVSFLRDASASRLRIHKVQVATRGESDVEFPLRAYWVIWTPALGVQHMAPRAGVMVFCERHPPSLHVGSPGDTCCGRPTTRPYFHVVFPAPKAAPGRAVFLRYCLEEFLAEEGQLRRKLERCDQLTAAERDMVVTDLRRHAANHGVDLSD